MFTEMIDSKILQCKERREGTRILNREIRGIHERGQGTGDSLKGVSRELFTEMLDFKILHCSAVPPKLHSL